MAALGPTTGNTISLKFKLHLTVEAQAVLGVSHYENLKFTMQHCHPLKDPYEHQEGTNRFQIDAVLQRL